MNNFIAGGCSFTFGHELSDSPDGKSPSRKTWAYQLHSKTRGTRYICTATAGAGNTGIARRMFNAVAESDNKVECVVVMWSFLSRYDWALPKHKLLENDRWASISPWDTKGGTEEAFERLQGSEIQHEQWQIRQDDLISTGVRPFAEAMYKFGANEYHETYLSWKSIIWLQNLLEKRKIPFMFTLVDNSLFFDKFEHKKNYDNFMYNLYQEIDISKWCSFGERMMGFNQWTMLNDYPRATTHPLDDSHRDAVKLIKPEFDRIIGGQL